MSLRDLLPLTALVLMLAPAHALAQEPFAYHDPGDLLPNSGSGLADATVYAPDMLFPLEGRAYANSQVYGPGGLHGPGGGQCDAANYNYPWRDNYCETRSWDMPLCPSGKGHQGQDIRPETCKDQTHATIATTNATVTNVGVYSIYITAPNGQRFDYLHGRQNAVVHGQQVSTGQLINLVSNNMGDTPTSIHLHFNIRQDVGGFGLVYVSPYMSLVEAYKRKFGLDNKAPHGAHDASTCEAVSGWAQDPDDPDKAIDVHLYYGGPADDPNAVGVAIVADEHREDLCQALNSCAHGFTVEVPRSLRDNLEHPVYAYAIDTEGGNNPVLSNSPLSFTCPPPGLPPGVRRHISDPEVLAAWKFSTFWHMANVDDATLLAIEEWDPIPAAPELIRADDGSPEVYLVDGPVKRWVPNPDVAASWGFDLNEVAILPAADVQAMPLGTPVRDEPFLVKATGPAVYVLDDVQCWEGNPHPSCADAGTTGADPTGSSGNASSGSTGSPTDSAGSSGSGPNSGPNSSTDPVPDADSATDSTPNPALPPGYGTDDAGCGCTSDSAPRGLALLALASLLRRRRRAR